MSPPDQRSNSNGFVSAYISLGLAIVCYYVLPVLVEIKNKYDKNHDDGSECLGNQTMALFRTQPLLLSLRVFYIQNDPIISCRELKWVRTLYSGSKVGHREISDTESGTVGLTFAAVVLLSGIWAIWLPPVYDNRKYEELHRGDLLYVP